MTTADSHTGSDNPPTVRSSLSYYSCTELALMPAALAIIAAVQCVASPGGSPWVKATVRS